MLIIPRKSSSFARKDHFNYMNIYIHCILCFTNLKVYGEEADDDVIMLHNHKSIYLDDVGLVVLGGGGNCFSFGTHLNKSPIVVNVTDLTR